MTTLHIRQEAAGKTKHRIRLTLRRPGVADIEGEATIAFTMPATEQEELRWYMEDYLQVATAVPEVQVRQVEDSMRRRGEELYDKVLAANKDTQAIWFAVREHLADLRIEITTGIAEAASIPWELMRDPQSDSAIALRVQSFVRVQSNPNIGFVPVPPADEGRVRLVYVVCRPGGRDDVELRAVANRLLQDLGADLARFDITALRPPTFEQLQKALMTGGKLDSGKAAAAIRQLMAWRYRFIVPPPGILKALADPYRANPPGEALREVAEYVHDCMRDTGLFGGRENTEMGDSMG